MSLAGFIFPFVFFANGTESNHVAIFRTETSEVRVSFFATDERNRPVADISKDDFAVVDNGTVVRDFRSLTHAAETELDVIALVDASESVHPRMQDSMNDVLHLISSPQQGSDLHFSVISFSGLRPTLLCAGNCRSALAGQRLQSLQAAGATPLWDALADAARLAARRQRPGMRSVLILFSDGRDTVSKASARDALEEIIASGAILYSVDLNRPGSDPEASTALQQMSEATGGRAFSRDAGSSSVLEAALSDLRASYVVTYQLPSHIVGFHSLRILPKHNLNLRFHCRSGYYYEEPVQ